MRTPMSTATPDPSLPVPPDRRTHTHHQHGALAGALKKLPSRLTQPRAGPQLERSQDPTASSLYKPRISTRRTPRIFGDSERHIKRQLPVLTRPSELLFPGNPILSTRLQHERTYPAVPGFLTGKLCGADKPACQRAPRFRYRLLLLAGGFNHS